MSDDPPHPGLPAPPATPWQTQAQRELGSRPLASLTREREDGIVVPPVYFPEDVVGLALDSLPGQPPWLRGRTARGPGLAGQWSTIQEVEVRDPAGANRIGRADIALGAHGLLLRTSAASSMDVEALLEGIDPGQTIVLIESSDPNPVLLEQVDAWLGDAFGGVVFDPLAAFPRSGRPPESLAASVDTHLGLAHGWLGVSLAPYHEGGATEADELGVALASVLELVRAGATLGLEFPDLVERLMWTFPIGLEPFVAIAKLRAARLAWAKLATALGAPEVASPWLHASCSRRTWTRHGAWVNALRATHACWAAAIGGADSIATAGFDARGQDSELGRRLAINTQLILREECGLDRVVDPGGGSWYIERSSDDLARAGWRRMQAIERAGGLLACLRSGSLQAEIETQARRVAGRVATRKQAITGVSTWPDLDEEAPASVSNESSAPAGAIPLRPLAEPFDALRDAGETWARAHGRGRIFAATIGPIADHQARLDFARSLFAVAGLELVESSDEDVMAGFRRSGCRHAILCGRDQDYPTHVAGMVRSLTAAGARRIWLAGRPPEGAWPGMTREDQPTHLFVGCDVVEALGDALDSLGGETP